MVCAGELIHDGRALNMNISKRMLFILAIGIELLFTIRLINIAAFPCGHDTLQYFLNLYYRVNHAVIYGFFPQWRPFAVHGISMPWDFTNSLFTNALVCISFIVKKINFITIFVLDMFLRQLVLITGTWLLSRRFFKHDWSSFFVAVTVTGTCIWFTQSFFALCAYYATPLIIWFLHRFFDSGKWHYYFLAGNLFVIQWLTSSHFFLPVISLLIFLYFLFYFLSDPSSRDSLKKIKIWPVVWSTLFTTLSLYGVYLLYGGGRVDSVIQYSLGRRSDNTVSLNAFLNFGYTSGSNTTPMRWLDIIFGISSATEYTLYMGVATVALLIVAIFCAVNRRNYHILALIVVLFAFTSGTLVSVLFYYVWPFMKLFRPIASLSILVRFWLCFFAGFGLDFLLSWGQDLPKPQKYIKPVYGVYLAIACMCSVFFYSLFLLILNDPKVYYRIGYIISGYSTTNMMGQFGSGYFLMALKNIMMFSSAVGILLFTFLKSKDKRIWIILICLIQVVDVYLYKTNQMSFRMRPFKEFAHSVTAFQKMPYAYRRKADFQIDNLRKLSMVKREYLAKGFLAFDIYNVVYADALDSFLFDDYLHQHGAIFCSGRPLDALLRAYGGQDLDDLSVWPKLHVPYVCAPFPDSHKSVHKVCGVSEDKIQFFSRAYLAGADKDIARLMTDNGYNGDLMFLDDAVPALASPIASYWNGAFSLADNQRLKLDYKVLYFDSDNIKIAVDMPNNAGGWLYYADTWHPQWKATVNGNPASVFRANIAYKAVPLVHGKNVVCFLFEYKYIRILQNIFCFNSLAWVVMLAVIIVNIVRRPKQEPL